MFKKTHESGLAATILTVSLLVSACGGGGGGGSDSTSSSSSSGDFTGLKAGLYVTDVTYVNNNARQSAVSYLSPTGAFTTVFSEGAGLSFGRFQFDGSNISGVSSDYRQLDDARNPEGFVEDKGAQQGTISGTIDSQGSGTFTTANAAGEINTRVKLTRQNTISDIGLSLKRVSGTYEKDESKVALTVFSDGSVEAHYYTQTIGCQLGGIETLSVPDTSINVFDIAYTMSNCDDKNRNGEYAGHGFIGPAENQQMRMVFAAQNGTVAMQFDGTR